MVANATEVKVLALALHQIRVLLSAYLGSTNGGPIEVRVAAHLAYALHNEALALAEGEGFNVEAALAKVQAIDGLLNVDDGSKFSHFVSSGEV